MSGPGHADPVFRRAVIGFHDAGCSPSGLDAAVGFARAMESQLVGVFVEDTPLLEWSSSPLSRHVTTLAGRWATATPDSLAAEFATAARIVRRRLSRVAEALGVSVDFRVERASAASLTFAATARPRDLLIVVEPADPMARLCYPFADLVRAIEASSAPVLYMPHGAQQRRGPVVSIEPQLDGESSRIAAEVAARIGESLISIGGADAPWTAPLNLQDVEHALAGVAERLVVLGRPEPTSSQPSLFATIAARRLVPTLVVGAGHPGAPQARHPVVQEPPGD
ncbi:MAG: hypothetical protein RLO51_06240 [Thalassobaculum sp.]|uniref:hypothetical protein n=1 Tax=Thalassobaculum sp. TaxID=2022740 RepID=UPI0032EB48A1